MTITSVQATAPVKYRIRVLALQPGAASDQAATALGRIFKKEPAQILPLLQRSGALAFTVPELETAKKYQSLLGQIGLICGVMPMEQVVVMRAAAAAA